MKPHELIEEVEKGMYVVTDIHERKFHLADMRIYGNRLIKLKEEACLKEINKKKEYGKQLTIEEESEWDNGYIEGYQDSLDELKLEIKNEM